MFVDSDDAGHKESCKSRSGFLIYVSTALEKWFSKKVSTIEISVFDAEFFFMKHGINDLRGLR